MPKLTSITYQPRNRDYADGQTDYIRLPREAAELVADHGLRDDRKAGRNRTRQVNLLSTDWLAAAAARGYRAQPGQFGEQLIIEGIDLVALPRGTHLALGESAVLEIVKGRTGCSRLEAAQGQSIAGLGPIGVLARVVAGGPIRVGDPVAVLETLPA
ncbi:MAG: MOSC domain-containing protein [Candidatus Promineofilum sp.]|nr:MOSC domain-containing protein [Promineifilum sp.]